jgi:hypothetical protein
MDVSHYLICSGCRRSYGWEVLLVIVFVCQIKNHSMKRHRKVITSSGFRVIFVIVSVVWLIIIIAI